MKKRIRKKKQKQQRAELLNIVKDKVAIAEKRLVEEWSRNGAGFTPYFITPNGLISVFAKVTNPNG